MRTFFLIHVTFVLIACNNNAKKEDSKKEDTVVTVVQPPPLPVADTLFTALGTEPFWAVYVINDHKIVFHPAGGEDVEVPWKNASSPPDTIPNQINASGNGNNIQVTIEKRDCSDGMSDVTYPYAVMVTVNGMKYAGCGREKK